MGINDIKKKREIDRDRERGDGNKGITSKRGVGQEKCGDIYTVIRN